MAAEIYWAEDDEENADLLPGRVTRVFKEGHELRITFSGEDGEYGGHYEGVLKLRIRPGMQQTKGTQSYRQLGENWEQVPFVVKGQFDDSRYTTFSGIWIERGRRIRIEVAGLPPSVMPTAKNRRAAKSNASGRRRRPS